MSVGWLIAAAIVLFIVLLLSGRVVVFFDHNGTLALKIKYLCFNIVKHPKKKKKTKSSGRKVKKKAAEISEESGSEKSVKSAEKSSNKKKDKRSSREKSKKKLDLKSLTLDDKIELLKLALSGFGKPLKKLLKRVELLHTSIRIVCGGSDAAAAAIKFGAVNIAVGNVLGLLDSFFTLKELDDMYITVDFQSEETLYDVYFEARLSLFAAVVGGFGLLRAFLRLNKTYNEKRANAKPSRAA